MLSVWMRSALCGCFPGKAGTASPSVVDGCGHQSCAIHSFHGSSTKLSTRAVDRADSLHSHPRPLNTFLHSDSDRARRQVECVCTERPHAIHGAPELSTRLSTGLWAPDGWWGGRHERALMHTRAELSTNTGVLSTAAIGAPGRCRVGRMRRKDGKIGVCARGCSYPQPLWITGQVVDNCTTIGAG